MPPVAGPQLVATAVLLAALYASPIGGIGMAYVALAVVGLVTPNYSQHRPSDTTVPPARVVWRQHRVQTFLYVALFFIQASLQYFLTAGLLPTAAHTCNRVWRPLGLQCDTAASSPLRSSGVPMSLLAFLSLQRCGLS